MSYPPNLPADAVPIEPMGGGHTCPVCGIARSTAAYSSAASWLDPDSCFRCRRPQYPASWEPRRP